jgi:4-hydroxybenzoate polyprenyltransferase
MLKQQSEGGIMAPSQHMSLARALIITMRPYLLFVSGITGLAGMAVAGPVPTGVVIPVFLASFLSYGFGQVLTDCFQTDTDALSAPYRPLTYGAVKRSSMMGLAVAGLLLCSSVFALRNAVNGALGAIAVMGLATYTPFKRRWWGGPLYNGWIVLVLSLIGYFAATGPLNGPPPVSAFPLFAAVLFGYANFVLAGYFKDISADAATGYNTFPVVFGRRAAAIASDVLAGVTVLACVAAAVLSKETVGTGIQMIPVAVFGAAGIVTTIRGQILLHRNTEDRLAHVPIGLVVQSYILLLSALVALHQPGWSYFLALHFLIYCIVFVRRPEATQI